MSESIVDLLGSLAITTPEDKRPEAFRSLCSAVLGHGRMPEGFQHINWGASERGALANAYPLFFKREHAKKFGQYFTPPDVASAALSALPTKVTSILDPSVGTGVFLAVAASKFPKARLVGIDIDENPLAAARITTPTAELVHADFMEWALQEVRKGRSYPAIVGNPPYIGYQRIKAKRNKEALQAISREVGSEPLRHLLDAWSGLADLSMYILVASWALLSKGGSLAFVMTNHWLERGYGKQVLSFLRSTGTIKVIVADPGRTWFPEALVHTSIVVYTKGTIDAGSIPVLWPERAHLNQLDLGAATIAKDPSDYNGFVNLEPNPSKSHGLAHTGWQAKQGLRTGCNDFFYAQPTASGPVVVLESADGGKRSFPIDLPESRLLPAIHALPSTAALVLHRQHADKLLLDLRGLGAERAVPPSTLACIRAAETTIYTMREGQPIRIPDLSAVSPNNRPQANPPRHWYEIPLSDRHFGSILVPRVSYGMLRAYRIDQRQPTITDANFVTFIAAGGQPWKLDSLWVTLNSNYVRLQAERLGATMGGGALKFEAAACNRLDLPENEPALGQVTKLAGALAKTVDHHRMLAVGEAIDRVCWPRQSAASTRSELESVLERRTARRVGRKA